MKNINIYKSILTFFCMFLVILAFAQKDHQQLPNIVIILADDLGYGDVSSYNENSALITPNIDYLTNEGVLFRDAHTSSAVCTPTRYGILTGRYNWRTELKSGVLSGYSQSLIKKDRLTIADVLKDKGYNTAVVGKWHLGWNWQFQKDDREYNFTTLKWGSHHNLIPKIDFSHKVNYGPDSHGFDYSYAINGSLDMPPYVYVENNIPTTIPTDTTVGYDGKGVWKKGITGSDFHHVDVLQNFTDKAIQYINKQAVDGKPFFLYFPLTAPHTPIIPSSKFIGRSNTNFYGDFILQVDDVVGQVIEALKDKRILKETLIIFTSDNGSAAPRSNFDELAKAGHDPSYIYRGSKADIFEGGHRVPFIVHWPEKISGNIISDETISTVDIMSTISEIVGYSLPENAGEDSYSYLSILEGKQYENPLREATVFHSIQGRFAIRKGDWKLILWPGSGGWSYPRTEDELRGLPYYQLYNLKNDPAEERNLVYLYPDKVKNLQALLEKYIQDGRSTPGTPQRNDGREWWPQLEWMRDK